MADRRGEQSGNWPAQFSFVCCAQDEAVAKTGLCLACIALLRTVVRSYDHPLAALVVSRAPYPNICFSLPDILGVLSQLCTYVFKFPNLPPRFPHPFPLSSFALSTTLAFHALHP